MEENPSRNIPREADSPLLGPLSEGAAAQEEAVALEDEAGDPPCWMHMLDDEGHLHEERD